MSSPDAVVRRWFEEVWNKRRESAIDEMMPADAITHGLGPQPLRGNTAFKPFFHSFSQAFTDLKVDVLRTVTQGDIVATHIHATGAAQRARHGHADEQGRRLRWDDHRTRSRRADRRRLELHRLPDDVSADGMGGGTRPGAVKFSCDVVPGFTWPRR